MYLNMKETSDSLNRIEKNCLCEMLHLGTPNVSHSQFFFHAGVLHPVLMCKGPMKQPILATPLGVRWHGSTLKARRKHKYVGSG